MAELIDISVTKDTKSRMIESVSRKIHGALSSILPPMDDQKDILKLKRYFHVPGRIQLTYEVMRDARYSKKEQNRSPYREIGLVMQVGRNS